MKPDLKFEALPNGTRVTCQKCGRVFETLFTNPTESMRTFFNWVYAHGSCWAV